MKLFNKKNPKVSLRYCFNCKKIRKFEYNPMIFHSECMRCFNRDSRQVTEKEFNESNYQIELWEN